MTKVQNEEEELLKSNYKKMAAREISIFLKKALNANIVKDFVPNFDAAKLGHFRLIM